MACNFLGDEWFVDSLGQPVERARQPWFYFDNNSKQIAGYVKQFRQLTYLTIKVRCFLCIPKSLMPSTHGPIFCWIQVTENTGAHRQKTIWIWEWTQMQKSSSWFHRNTVFIFKHLIKFSKLFTISEYIYDYLANFLLFSRKSYDKILENILKFKGGGPGVNIWLLSDCFSAHDLIFFFNRRKKIGHTLRFLSECQLAYTAQYFIMVIALCPKQAKSHCWITSLQFLIGLELAHTYRFFIANGRINVQFFIRPKVGAHDPIFTPIFCLQWKVGSCEQGISICILTWYLLYKLFVYLNAILFSYLVNNNSLDNIIHLYVQ